MVKSEEVRDREGDNDILPHVFPFIYNGELL